MTQLSTRTEYVARHGGEDYDNGKVRVCGDEARACMPALVLDELGITWAPECVDPDDTRHEHCSEHGCVEYLCCGPTGAPDAAVEPMGRERAIDYLLQLEEVFRLDYCEDDKDSAALHAVTLEAFAALGVPAAEVKRQFTLGA